MRGRKLVAAWTAAAAALAGGCATRPVPAPPPAPAIAPAPPPAAAPTPPPPAPEWRDLPLSPGDWSYSSDSGGSEARFGSGLRLQCDSARRQVLLTREGAGGAVRVRTSYGERMLAPGGPVPAADSLLDEMAFSRGRFAVEAEGVERLIVPAWPEPARVVEDCRG